MRQGRETVIDSLAFAEGRRPEAAGDVGGGRVGTLWGGAAL